MATSKVSIPKYISTKHATHFKNAFLEDSHVFHRTEIAWPFALCFTSSADVYGEWKKCKPVLSFCFSCQLQLSQRPWITRPCLGPWFITLSPFGFLCCWGEAMWNTISWIKVIFPPVCMDPGRGPCKVLSITRSYVIPNSCLIVVGTSISLRSSSVAKISSCFTFTLLGSSLMHLSNFPLGSSAGKDEVAGNLWMTAQTPLSPSSS